MLVIVLFAIFVYGACSLWIIVFSAMEMLESGTGSMRQLLGVFLASLFWPVTIAYMSLAAAASKWRLGHASVRHSPTLETPRHSA